jgi:DNA-binding beta-propeller fold protein YncE
LAQRRRTVVAATVALIAAAASALAGCGAGRAEFTDTQPAAAPAVSPQPGKTPAGTVLPITAKVTAAAVGPGTNILALAVSGPDRLLLVDLSNPVEPPRTVELPGVVEQLDPGAREGELLAPVRSAGMLLTVDVTSQSDQSAVRSVALDGGPVAATVVDGQTVVALADRPAVAVLDGERVVHTLTEFAGPADVVAAGGKVAVLDRPRTAVTTIDTADGKLGPSLRAGNGATNAVADRFGRVLVTDTRDGELLAFSADPLIMRQRFPVPGAPYAIAYDPTRDLAWVTLTERNEVVGYDVAGGEPVERHRLATIRQPNAVAVDPNSGAVIVASGTGDGVQVVKV